MSKECAETIISFCGRLHLCSQLNVKQDELVFIGPQEGLGYVLILFNVDRPGDRLHRSTRSVRVDL